VKEGTKTQEAGPALYALDMGGQWREFFSPFSPLSFSSPHVWDKIPKGWQNISMKFCQLEIIPALIYVTNRK
jgi:hypothetical protein